MKSYKINALELFEIDCLLRNPAFLESTDHPLVTFIAGRAKDDYGDLFEDLFLEVPDPDFLICIPGHDGSYTANGVRVENGYPGFEVWSDEIHNLLDDHPRKNILPCVIREGHEKVTNTREESEGFILRAKERGWNSARVLAHAHQMPRLMCCLILATQTLSYPMKLLPMFASFSSWTQEVHGSLGQVNKKRWEHIEEEFKRIQGYIENGWAVPLSELKDYLLNPNPLE